MSTLDLTSDCRMNSHSHDHQNAGQAGGITGAWWTTLHRDWRFWVALVLASLAMILYMLSMEEAIQPGGAVEEPVPEAAAD